MDDDVYRRFYKPIRTYVWSYVESNETAEELAQETFLKAYKHWGTYDPVRGALSTWLWSIARNTAIDYLRNSSNAASFEEYSDETEYWEYLDCNDTPERDMGVIERLPTRQREAVQMRLSGMELSEIAKEMDVSRVTVKLLLHRAKGGD